MGEDRWVSGEDGWVRMGGSPLVRIDGSLARMGGSPLVVSSGGEDRWVSGEDGRVSSGGDGWISCGLIERPL